MSDVVSTVLIILIVVVAIAVIGTIVLRMSSNTKEQIEVASSPINVEIVGGSVQVNPILSKVLLNVKRSPASGNINGINFVLTDDTGNSQVIRKDFLPGDFNALEAKSVEFDYDPAVITGKIKSISAAPILVGSSGKEFVGNRPSLKTLSGGEKMAFMAAYWKFDSDGDFKDYSGNGNDGSSTKKPSFVSNDPTMGAVMSFAGSINPQYIQVPNSDSLNFGTGSFSIVFWANNLNNQAGTGGKIVDKLNSLGVGYAVRAHTSLYLNPIIYSSSTVKTNPDYSVSTSNQWRCISIVFDRISASKQIKSYIYDGVSSLSQLSTSQSQDLSLIANTDNSDLLYIGSRLGGGSEFYNGRVDDLMIFNKALSSTEAQTVCNYAKTY